MGGRDLPRECHHGVVVDWGDFGPPDPEDGDYDNPEWLAEQYPTCADCEVEAELRAHTATLALRAPAPIDDALFERVMDQVMTGLCALSDIGVDVGISSQRNQDIWIDLTLGDGWTKQAAL